MTDITPTQRRRVDWDAVERDYRTDTLTLRELAEKHGVSHTTISRRAERDGWQKDLTEAIRQATSTRLITETVQQKCTSAHQNATDLVQAVAEVNSRIILKHQRKLSELHDLVEFAKAKLKQMGDALVDVKEAATFVQATGNLAAATKTLIEQERKAFGLDDDGAKKRDSVECLLRELGD